MGLRQTLRSGGNWFFIIQSGMISSAIVLAILWTMAEYWPGVHIIGWYYAIIPVGAIAAGIAACVGYFLAAMSTKAVVPRWLMVPILLAQLAVYLAAEYVEYRQFFWEYEPAPISFIHYFDLRSRSYSLIDSRGHEEPLQGYILRLFEMSGFAAPGLLVPLALRNLPRCAQCKGSDSTRTIATLRFTPDVSFDDWRIAQNPEEVGYSEWEARASYFEQCITEFVTPLLDAIKTNQAEAIEQALDDLCAHSDTVTAPHSVITLTLYYCPSCMVGRFGVGYRYQEDGRPRYDGLPSIPVAAVAIDALQCKV